MADTIVAPITDQFRFLTSDAGTVDDIVSPAGQSKLVRCYIDSNGNVIGLVGNGKQVSMYSKSSLVTKRKFFDRLKEGANYRSGLCLIAPPAWAAGLNVSQGYTCVNNGNLYGQMNQFNPVATTAGNAPTTTGRPAVAGTDTLHWMYLGAWDNSMLAPQVDAPIVTESTVPASCTQAVEPIQGRWNPGDQLSLDNTVISNQFKTVPGAYTGVNGGGGAINGIASGIQNIAIGLTVWTDSPIAFTCQQQNYGNTWSASRPYTINGYKTYPKGGDNSPRQLAYAGNNWQGVTLDWTSKPNRPRRLRFALDMNLTHTGIWIPPQYNVWAQKSPNDYIMCVEGDSFTQGGMSGDGFRNTLYMRISEMLGNDNVFSAAVGGGGFLQVANDGTTILSRLAARVLPLKPDIIYINATDWDLAYTSAQRQAAYVQYYQTYLASNPNGIILHALTRSFSANNLTNDNDIIAAVASMGTSQIQVVDTKRGASTYSYTYSGQAAADNTGSVSKAWFSGTGNVWQDYIPSSEPSATAGSAQWNLGNFASAGDGHPNVRGLEAMEWNIYHGIVDAMTNV